MNKKLILIICIFISFLIGACGGSSNDSDNKLIAQEKNFVYDYLKGSYLWYDKVPENVNMQLYSSPESLLKNLKYRARDSWSYITSLKSHNQLFSEGEYDGYGFNCSIYEVNMSPSVVVTFVYKDSPAARAGMERGDIILEISEKKAMDIVDNNLWNHYMGNDVVDMKIQKIDSTIIEKTIQVDIVKINTVLHHSIFQLADNKTGYIVFKSFLEKSLDELDIVFDYFIDNHVDSLIVDLRYNEGGRVSVANHLASLIAGKNTKGKVFSKIIHNDKYTDYDKTFQFDELDNSLDLNKVVFIVDSGTCSSSELVINSLAPHIEIYVTGGKTCGKPVGMHGREFGDKWYSFIEFSLVNSESEGDYYDGIVIDDLSTDNPMVPFGMKGDQMLQNALNFFDRGYALKKVDSSNSQQHLVEKLFDMEIDGFRREIGAF